MKFLLWHYHEGLHGFITLWWRYFVYTWKFFSVEELIRTVLLPWHRDITPKTWRGFDPIKSLRRITENIFSRIIGAIARLIVVGIALGLELGVVVVGAFLFVLWVGVIPFGMIGVAGFIVLPWLGGVFMVSLLILLFSFFCFSQYTQRSYAERSLAELFTTTVFLRVLARVDVDPKEISLKDVETQEALQVFLERKNVRLENFVKALTWEVMLADTHWRKEKFWSQENMSRVHAIARQWKYGYTPQLDEVSEDMNLVLSWKFSTMRVCAQTKALQLMTLVLARPSQNSVLIIGLPGMGRKTLIEWFVKDIYEGNIRGSFRDARILRLDIERVIAQNGGHPKRSVNQLEYLFAQAAYAGNVILVIDDMEYYVGEYAEQNGNPDIGPLLERYLPYPNFRVIATMAMQSFHVYMEKGRGILKSMERIELEEVNEELAVDIMLDEYMELEERQVVFTIKALRHIAVQSGKFNAHVPLPERAMDLSNEVFIYWQNRLERYHCIDSRVVDEYITLKTGMPAGTVAGEEKEKLLHLENLMAERIVGQKQAVRHIAKALRKARSEMSGSMRPIGSFLFLGPTGVGKTEMAKVLSTTYFGGEAGMARMDMSEFQSPSSVEQLIGSRERNMPGRLTTLIQEHPYGVLLLDELEKASSGVLDIFLQILDEGFFTDAFGTKVRFNNLIIIATSNAGAPKIKQFFENYPEGDTEFIEKEVVDEIVENGTFRVEFLNRFDGVIFFAPLKQEELIRVTELLLEEFARDVWENKRIRIDFERNVAGQIVEHGYEAPFGARSLRRFIADTVEAIVAERIIAEEMNEGEVIMISGEDIEGVKK